MVYGHPLVIHPLEPVGDLIRSAGRVRFSAGIDAWPGGTGEPERKFRGKPGNVIWLVVSTPLKNIWVSCSPDCRHFAGKISFLNSGFPMISERKHIPTWLSQYDSINCRTKRVIAATIDPSWSVPTFAIPIRSRWLIVQGISNRLFTPWPVTGPSKLVDSAARQTECRWTSIEIDQIDRLQFEPVSKKGHQQMSLRLELPKETVVLKILPQLASSCSECVNWQSTDCVPQRALAIYKHPPVDVRSPEILGAIP